MTSVALNDMHEQFIVRAFPILSFSLARILADIAVVIVPILLAATRCYPLLLGLNGQVVCDGRLDAGDMVGVGDGAALDGVCFASNGWHGHCGG